MNDALEEVLAVLATVMLGILGFIFIVQTIEKGKASDKLLEEKVRMRSNINYSLAHLEDDMTLTSAETVTDILAGDVMILKDSNALTQTEKDNVTKAKNGNSQAIKWLKQKFSRSYKKVYVFDKAGNVTAIDYQTQ